MSDADDAERFAGLVEGVLYPLVLGGSVELQRPFGGPLALRIGSGRSLDALPPSPTSVAGRDATAVSVARVRRARLLAPVDTVDDLDPGDWALVAALSDLLQVTNHKLAGVVTGGRAGRILTNLAWLLARIPAPKTPGAALSRHATFARVLEVARTDTEVSWWTGSAAFRGEPVPGRLTAWPDLRRVHVAPRRVLLADMAAGARNVAPADFADVLALWLTRTPLTDLATASRVKPAFAWSASTLSLVATLEGRSLAFRAVARQPAAAVLDVLAAATAQVPRGFEEARRVAEAFLAEAKRGLSDLRGASAASG